jgi:hypothetical protein
MVERLTHAQVLERVPALDIRIEKLAARLVHSDEDDPVLGPFEDPDARRPREARHVLRRRIVDEVDLAREQRGDARCIGHDRGVGHLVGVAFEEPRLDAPPVRVLHEHGLHVGLARLQHVRPGAVRLVRGDHVLFPRVVLRLQSAILLAPRLAHDVDRVDVLELDRVWPAGRELDGIVVDLLRNSGRVRVGAQLRSVAARPLEAEHDVVGGERRAVMELDAPPKVESPRRRVHLRPRLGERRLQSELLVAGDQELADELVDVVGEVLVLRMRIGGLHVAATRPAQRLGVGTHCGERERRDERADERGSTGGSEHGALLRGRTRSTSPAGYGHAGRGDDNVLRGPRGRIRARLGARSASPWDCSTLPDSAA